MQGSRIKAACFKSARTAIVVMMAMSGSQVFAGGTAPAQMPMQWMMRPAVPQLSTNARPVVNVAAPVGASAVTVQPNNGATTNRPATTGGMSGGGGGL